MEKYCGTLLDNGGKLGGYSGAAIWGSSPSIDIFRGLVYVGTGNLFLAPADVLLCRIVWAKQLRRYDVFYFACLVPNNPDCPPGPNLDADFGEAPMLLSIRWRKRLCDVVVAEKRLCVGFGS
ncbi:uncharacterized protein Fot_16102 [Forsythia ovata]|uniref:Uncharacterized protein n=1 Tax=Forsythia ovata TaxID=205694 RepID=A0ABD1WB27_9LAMI